MRGSAPADLRAMEPRSRTGVTRKTWRDPNMANEGVKVLFDTVGRHQREDI